MVIDTSAVLAWLKHELERERIVAALEKHPVCRISAVSLLEANIVVRAREHHAMPGKLQAFWKKLAQSLRPSTNSRPVLPMRLSSVTARVKDIPPN